MVNETEKLMGNFIENWKTSTLPTNTVFEVVQYPTVRTTLYNQQTPINTHFQPILETFGKLK